MVGDRSRPTVVVTGDVTFDWNVADTTPASRSEAWSQAQHASISVEPGGACLSAALAAAVMDVDLRSIRTGSVPRPDDRRFHHSTASWARFPVVRGADRNVWRISDYLGLTRQQGALRAGSVEEWSLVDDDPPEADVVLIDDGGLGFSDDSNRWPQVIRGPTSASQPAVVLKTADPLGRSELFRRLVDSRVSRLIVVTTVADVRRAGVEVSRGLSWEATAEDLVRAFSSSAVLGPVLETADIVVSFGAAGAFVARRRCRSDRLEAKLVFDPGELEATWEAARPGGMVGATTCLAIGIVSALASSGATESLIAGIRRGVAGIRALHETGFLPSDDTTTIRFPHREVAAALVDGPSDLAMAEVPPEGRRGRWSILEEHHVAGFDHLAERIVRIGPERALAGMPLGRFGGLRTADRREIEGFRSIQNLIAGYCMVPRPRRPLSIAVFGPPGSGKSFTVTEIARSLHAGEVEKLTFNLSQLESPRQLIAAFHRVRDAGLSARLPLVFWDEFDATLDGEPLGWLRHFLAPMQDGEFLDGQLVHPIGRAIFVFAGGTAERLDDLGQDLGRSVDDRSAAFRSVKGPDFLSRLRGTVEILGPDPNTDNPTDDRAHLVRRAIVLHSLLARTWPGLQHPGADGFPEFAIDSGVLAAFLGVGSYRHGVRSMESIVTSSRLADERDFHCSALPPPGQLRLHVDDTEFLALARQVPIEGDLADVLAERLHRLMCTHGNKHGWDVGPIVGEFASETRAASRAAILDIPRKLASAGYVIVSADVGGDIDIDIDIDIDGGLPEEIVESLARLEHDRWMARRIGDGWSWGEEDGSVKIDPDLVPWDPMTAAERIEQYPFALRRHLGPGSLAGNESARDKDRLIVRAIPELLASAGLRIVPIHE